MHTNVALIPKTIVRTRPIGWSHGIALTRSRRENVLLLPSLLVDHRVRSPAWNYLRYQGTKLSSLVLVGLKFGYGTSLEHEIVSRTCWPSKVQILYVYPLTHSTSLLQLGRVICSDHVWVAIKYGLLICRKCRCGTISCLGTGTAEKAKLRQRRGLKKVGWLHPVQVLPNCSNTRATFSWTPNFSLQNIGKNPPNIHREANNKSKSS